MDDCPVYAVYGVETSSQEIQNYLFHLKPIFTNMHCPRIKNN